MEDLLLDFLDATYLDQIKGGLADKKKPSDFSAKSLIKGMSVEMEHTDDLAKALEISMDHLSENPKYYEELKKVSGESIDNLFVF